MANRERGEFRLVARDRSYTLRLTVEACCELEDRTDRTLSQVIDEVNAGRATAIRTLLWASLQAYHSEQCQTWSAAGTLIDELGGLPRVLPLLSDFMQLNEDDSDRPTPGREGQPAKEAPTRRWRRLYIDARKAGIEPALFWGFSLRELWRELEARREQWEAEWKRDRELAWHTAALTRCEKMPSFQQFTGIRARQKQTPEEMKNALTMLRAMYPNSKHQKGKKADGPR